MKKGLVLILVIIVGGVIIYTKTQPQKEVEGNSLTLSGNIEVTETDVGFKIPGRIDELLTDEGKYVKKDDKLATLDNAELVKTVENAYAVLRETIERLDELKTGSRPQEINQARLNLNIAEVELEKVKKDYDRAVSLSKEGTISKQEMDLAKKIYDSAVLQKQNALEALSLVEEGPRKEEIKIAETKVLQAKPALAIAEEKLKDATLSSPVSGIILKKFYENGEIVSAGVPIFTIGNLEDPWIKVYVKEVDLGLVKLGQKAEITVDTYPGKIYEGYVSYISSEAEFTPKNIQTREERVKLVFGIKVRVKNMNDELKPGMPADVRIFFK